MTLSLYKTKVQQRQFEQALNRRVFYHLQSPSTVSTIHRRLGHPSMGKSKVFVPQLSHLMSLDCELC